MNVLRTAVIALLVTAPLSANAADLNCGGNAGTVEEFRYTWRLRGGLRWVAGIMFPTSGVATLKTAYPGAASADGITSELLITSPSGKKGGYYQYESQMDDDGQKTMMTFHGYAWGEKSRLERTTFDYSKGLARIRKQTPEKVENKVKQLPDQQLRDILTAIHYMRQNAANIRGAVQTSIYSDGKEYPVIFKPAGRQTFVIEGKRLNALGFEVADAPGGKQWPGGIKIWLSEDARRIPMRIEIRQSFASMQLDLQSFDACTAMPPARTASVVVAGR